MMLLFTICCRCSAQNRMVPVLAPAQQQLGCTAQGQLDNATALKALLKDTILPALNCPMLGACPKNPASSCKQIAEENPSAPSGNYWLQKCDGSIVKVYCDMNSRCCNSTSGWMRIGFLNMTDPVQQCPYGLREKISPNLVRACEKRRGNGCTSLFFNTHYVPYSRVCGRIIAYQDGSPDAFQPFNIDATLTLDENFFDGLSLTYGLPPRKHIWTFVAALDEVRSNAFTCPCIKTDSEYTAVVPPFIGNDYFCDTASAEIFQFRFYDEDPLWDGQGCGPTNECCQFNSPPWFCKDLQDTTRENIELRNCADQHQGDEEVAVQLLEIYVQ